MRTLFSAGLLICAASVLAADQFEAFSRSGGAPAAARETVDAVLSRAALVRDIPARRFAAMPAVIVALFDHPVLTAEIARGMGLGDFYVAEKGGGAYMVREGRSIEAEFREIFRAEGVRLYLIDGQYYGSFFIHLSGEALLLARYRPVDSSGIEVKADAALSVDNRFYGFLVFLFPPLFRTLVDRRLSFYMDVAERLTVALARDPGGVYNRLLDRGLLSAEERGLFAHLFIQSGAMVDGINTPRR